jgi:predicted enzyme related to lactoylglutathione lyase
MGEMGTYTCFQTDEKDRAGLMQMPPQAGDAPPHWLSYIGVDDVDESAEKVTSLGGQIHCPPMDIPGVGRFSVVADPTGAMFALFKGTPKPE